jgi:hypothetical protein
MSKDWGRTANKGELTMILLTAKRAALDGVPMAPESQYVGIMQTDDEDMPNFALSFSSAELVRVWLEEMEPRTIAILCGADEDARSIHVAILEFTTDTALH